MSTRSIIGIKTNDGTIKSVYCHHDGYLSYNGVILASHYTTVEKVEKLISLGDLSTLGIDPDAPYNDSKFGVVDYHRWRNESIKISFYKNENKFLDECSTYWIDFIYLFDEKNKEWSYLELSKNTILKSLKPELVKLNLIRQ